MKAKRVSKAKRLSKAQTLFSDRISSLPPNIIETILCLLPIKEAVRTSILSREWRYYWTRIPKLISNPSASFGWSTDPSVLERTYDIASARKKMDERCKIFYAIYQVLLLHQGPILEFTLDIEAEKGCVEIDQVIIHLSRKNTVKKFTVTSHSDDDQYSVPLSIFSLNQLTHLRIAYSDFDHQPTFNGFGSLKSLYLRCVCMSSKTLRHILSNCPLLKCFTLYIHMENVLNREESTIIELFECLPIIEYLTMWGSVLECFVLDQFPKSFHPY